MATVMKVNPTRMELSKLKKRLKTARRGHKLLKDKRDEMVKQFLELVRKNRELRTEVEENLKQVQTFFPLPPQQCPRRQSRKLLYARNRK